MQIKATIPKAVAIEVARECLDSATAVRLDPKDQGPEHVQEERYLWEVRCSEEDWPRVHKIIGRAQGEL